MTRDEDRRRQLHLGEVSGWALQRIAFSGGTPTGSRLDDLVDEPAAFVNADGGVAL